LLTLGSGLREQADAPIFTPQILAGLRDTVGVLRDLAPDMPRGRLEADLEQSPAHLRAALALLESAAGQAAQIAAAFAHERMN
jgi:hypothetical protein